MSSSFPEPSAHEPVLLKEVVDLLNPAPGQIIVDATLGNGGHAQALLPSLGDRGRLIGIDRDPLALEKARRNLKSYPNVTYFQANFNRLAEVLGRLNLRAVDAVLLDVGLSSAQLAAGERGFSFLKEGPLDMRMDPGDSMTAGDLVNDLSQDELEKIFREYGEERWARRIALRIVEERRRKPVETTGELVKIIEKAVPPPARFGPRHPAMRVFQALRIRVNRELESLEEALPQAFGSLKKAGRLAVISFHSLEDRIVKRMFREWNREGRARALTKKPVRPTREEIRRNPRSRSAKLRVVERTENT